MDSSVRITRPVVFKSRFEYRSNRKSQQPQVTSVTCRYLPNLPSINQYAVESSHKHG